MTRLASRFGAANLIRRDRPLTQEELFRVVPSVFSEEKHASRSARYTWIPTIAETTPVLEAANLQQDLRRAGIEPWAWVVNNSLAAAEPSSPFLKTRANRELPLISDVEEQYAKRIALTALQSEEPVGIDLLKEMAK